MVGNLVSPMLVSVPTNGGYAERFYFQVLSYAGTLTIAAITDPDHGPDLDDLMQRLGLELELIMASQK